MCKFEKSRCEMCKTKTSRCEKSKPYRISKSFPTQNRARGARSLHFKNRIRMHQSKALLSARMHLEMARGTDEQNKYCGKEEDAILRVGRKNVRLRKRYGRRGQTSQRKRPHRSVRGLRHRHSLPTSPQSGQSDDSSQATPKGKRKSCQENGRPGPTQMARGANMHSPRTTER